MDRITSDTLANETNDTLTAAGSQARRKVNEIADWGREQAAKLKGGKLENVWLSTVDYVKANPGKAILVSLALGVVIGGMMSRRRGGE